jgi:cytochrome c oxidase assembly factor CtaG
MKDYGIALYAAAFILLGDSIAEWLSTIFSRKYPNGAWNLRQEYFRPAMRFIVAVVILCIAIWIWSR